MSLRVAYELGFGLAIALALSIVLLGGAMPAVSWVALAVPLASAVMHTRGRALDGSIGTIIAGAALFWGLATLVSRGVEAALLGGAIALVGILAGRVLTRITLGHDLQALLLSLLLVFAGTALNLQITYGLIFIAYAIAVSWSLVTRQLVAGAEREANRAGGAAFEVTMARRDVATPTFFGVVAAVSVLILLSTTVLFLLFPRLGFRSIGLFAQQSTRFPSDVSLFGSPRASFGSGEVVARVSGVSFGQFDRGLYLRGMLYDRLTSTGFQRSGDWLSMAPSRLALAPTERWQTYEIYMQPFMGPLMMSLGPSLRAHIVSGGHANPSTRTRLAGRGPSGELTANQQLTGPIRYLVDGGVTQIRSLSEPPDNRYFPEDDKTREMRSHFLALPEDLDPQVVPLAGSLVDAEAPAAERAAALRRFLLDGFEYTLEQPNGGKPDPLAAFLFEDRRGHCEYFATAYATLLRAVGVPSRVAGGYMGGTWDEEDELVVFTTANAHAWVEWFEPDKGWVVDDATPASIAPKPVFTGLAAWLERVGRFWDDNVVDYGINEQVALITRAADALRSSPLAVERKVQWRRVAWVFVGGVLLAFGVWWFRRPRRRRVQRHALGQAIITTVEAVTGKAVDEATTVREAVRAVRPTAAGVQALDAALAAYERARFGGRPLSRARVRQLVRGLRGLR